MRETNMKVTTWSLQDIVFQPTAIGSRMPEGTNLIGSVAVGGGESGPAEGRWYRQSDVDRRTVGYRDQLNEIWTENVRYRDQVLRIQAENEQLRAKEKARKKAALAVAAAKKLGIGVKLKRFVVSNKKYRLVNEIVQSL